MRRRSRIMLSILVAVVLVIVGAALVVRPPSVAARLESSSSQPAPQLIGTTAAKPLRVLVIGGSSGIGLSTVKLATARGHAVVAMSRSVTPSAADANPRLVRGDILDAAAVAAAVDGVDAVVISINARPSRQETTLFSQGMQNVLAALALRPEVVVISVTGIGAGDSRGHGGFGYDSIIQPMLLKQIYLDKDREEAVLRASSVPYRIVRPGFLTNDTKSTPYRVVTEIGRLRCGSISRAQVAEFILAALEQDLYARETVLLTR